MSFKVLPALAASAILLSMFAGGETQAMGETATATLKFADGSNAGTIKLTESAAGGLLKLDLKGLSPGGHGLHVHEVGKCEGDFSSAGAINNPLGAKHGFLNEEGPMAGDLPNVVAAADGTASGEIVSPFLHLSKDSEDTVLDEDGSAFILFEKADDHLTEPEGGAGTRVACGVLKAD
jgi:Cu-Zn family superoxide dismutase